MTPDQQTLERIVLDVMARLMTQPAGARIAEPAAAPVGNPVGNIDANAAAAIPGSDTNCLSLTEDVITADLLKSRLKGERSISIAPRSILTPSAQDLLRSRGIGWTRAARNGVSATASKSSGNGRWRVIVSAAGGLVATVIDDLQKGGAALDRELAGLPAEAARQAISVLCRAEALGVVVLAAETHLVVCLANRNPRIRAAAVTDARSLAAARNQLGANLLCVDPGGKSFFELRKLLRDCIGGGHPTVPSAWAE